MSQPFDEPAVDLGFCQRGDFSRSEAAVEAQSDEDTFERCRMFPQDAYLGERESTLLDLAGDRIVLPARFVKANEDQWIPLHPDLRAALAALPDTGDEVFPFRSRKTGKPLTRNGITNNVIHLARMAGVKLSMHRLRKGFGCRVAAQLGRGNAPVLHRLMRHWSMQITMDFYASVAQRATRRHPPAGQRQGGKLPIFRPSRYPRKRKGLAG